MVTALIKFVQKGILKMKTNQVIRDIYSNSKTYYASNINCAVFYCNQHEDIDFCPEYDNIDNKNCIYYNNGICNNIMMNALTAFKIGYDIFNSTSKFFDELKPDETNIDEIKQFKDECRSANLIMRKIFDERLTEESEGE
jgi:hypothetical protein